MAKKKKHTLIYEPYTKGSLWIGGKMFKEALKVFCYFLFFILMYTIVGASLSFESFFLRLVTNGLVLFVCVGVIFNKAIGMGQDDVALGETVYTRLQEGKPVNENDKKLCYRMGRAWLIFLLAIIPVLLITVPAAIGSQRQMYVQQALPEWVKSFESQEEIYQPLMHHTVQQQHGFIDLLRIISRLLISPFIGIFTTKNKDTLLLLEKLAPILAILPAFAFPVGYMMGPYARARVHGDIDQNKKRQKRRNNKNLAQKKAVKQTEQKQNELI